MPGTGTATAKKPSARKTAARKPASRPRATRQQEAPAPPTGTRLEFEGTIEGIKIDLPKEQTGYSSVKPNDGTILTVRIRRPNPPVAPHRPYELDHDKPAPFGGRTPAAPTMTRKADEDDEAFVVRSELAQADYQQRLEAHTASKANREREITRYEEAEVRYARELAQYQTAAAAYGPRLMSYGSLAGVVAAIGRSDAAFVITPLNQDRMPGFTAQARLLPAPSEVADDPDYDLDADGDLDEDDEE